MKFILFFLNFWFSFLFAQHVFLSGNYQQQQTNSLSIDSGNLMKGWLNFFTYEHRNLMDDLPKKFEFNPAYSEKSNIQNQKDDWGPLNIPSDTSFFFILTKSSLYVTNSRRVLILCLFYHSLNIIRMIFPKHTKAWRFLG